MQWTAIEKSANFQITINRLKFLSIQSNGNKLLIFENRNQKQTK